MIVTQPQEWTYEMICEYCREAVLEMDTRRWLIGDSAITVEKHYGDRNLKEFAKDIGQNHSTVQSYRRVSHFYPKSVRADVISLNPNLTYTYYRDALRLGELNQALAWLAECSANGWTTDEAARYLTEKLGRKTNERIEGVVYEVNGRDVSIQLDIDHDFKPDQRVTIKVQS